MVQEVTNQDQNQSSFSTVLEDDISPELQSSTSRNLFPEGSSSKDVAVSHVNGHTLPDDDDEDEDEDDLILGDEDELEEADFEEDEIDVKVDKEVDLEEVNDNDLVLDNEDDFLDDDEDDEDEEL